MPETAIETACAEIAHYLYEDRLGRAVRQVFTSHDENRSQDTPADGRGYR